ncbi:MAG: hypothetical protein RLW42_01720 [Gammaproteobacteria bacterium]
MIAKPPFVPYNEIFSSYQDVRALRAGCSARAKISVSMRIWAHFYEQTSPSLTPHPAPRIVHMLPLKVIPFIGT